MMEGSESYEYRERKTRIYNNKVGYSTQARSFFLKDSFSFFSTSSVPQSFFQYLIIGSNGKALGQHVLFISTFRFVFFFSIRWRLDLDKHNTNMNGFFCIYFTGTGK